MKNLYLSALLFLWSTIVALGQNTWHGSGNQNQGSYNSLFGYYAGFKLNSGAHYNLVLGSSNSPFRNLSSGDGNVFVGHNSGFKTTTGNSNVFIGRNAGYNNFTGSNNIFIGRSAGFSETGSNKLYIDNSSTSAPLVYGDFSSNQVGINVRPSSGYTFHVGGKLRTNGRIKTPSIEFNDGSVISSARSMPSNLTLGGSLIMGSNGFIEDDGTLGGHNDDWIKLNGYIEMKSATDSYGIVLRSRTASDYLALTQLNGSSYLTENSTYGNYFIKGTNRDTYFGGKAVTTRKGISGTYNSAQVQGIWSIGASYGINETNNNFGTQYGLAYAHTNSGQGVSGWGHQILHVNNGTMNAATSISFGHGYFKGNLGVGVTDPQEKLHVNGNIRGNQTGGALRIKSAHGWIDVGPRNTGWAHFQTDRPRYYFDKGVTVDQGLISSYDEDLQLQTSGTTRMTISNTTGDVTIDNNLSIAGILQLDPAGINQDNSLDDLLVMRWDGSLASRSVRSIESPWLLDIIAQDTAILTCDTVMIGSNILVDVFDLNGNLRIGNNSYIDDDLTYGDGDGPDDWMRFNSRIEFKSSAAKHGIVLYDKNSFLNYTNLFHDAGSTYLSNNADADTYFMKATGRDVEFGGDVSLTSMSGTDNFALNGPTSLYISMDNDNNSGSMPENNAIIFGRNDISGAGANFNELMRINEDGNVGIGTFSIPSTYKLAVDGKILAEEVKVALSTGWPDYVFAKGYKRMPLQDLKSFIEENHHLPNIPSQKEIKEAGGISVGEMNAKLLEKLEELTLYLIEEDEKIDALRDELTLLKKENEALKNRLENLEN